MKAPGGTRLLAVILVSVAAVAASADITPTPPPVRTVVWLGVGQRPAYPAETGLLSWELYRQAILIAARDGLGLQTRDQALREWNDDPPIDQTVAPFLTGHQLAFRSVVQDSPKTVWTGEIRAAQISRNYSPLEVAAEKLSRTDFVAALKKAGFVGKGNSQNPGAAAQPQAEALVGNLDELSQFAAVRLSHEVIRGDGESPQRLGVLVRAYANLGQLTRFQWSLESKVFSARALLYAQRMVAADPQSAFALWHRAYARALAGLQGTALTDAEKADTMDASEPPAWASLIEPFCRFDLQKLDDARAAEPSQAPLAGFLAFLTVENTGCQAAEMNAAQAALDASPNCLRLIDAMCEQTGPGMLDELTERGPQILSRLLGDQLEKTPDLPQALIDQIHQLKRPGGNPADRQTICKALIDQGIPSKDTGEPSWACLGRMIQEITFAQVRRRADLVADQWGIDASDYAAEVAPLVADHPYHALIQAYGLLHRDTMQPAIGALQTLPLDQLTLTCAPLIDATHYTESPAERRRVKVYNALLRNLDRTAFDVVDYLWMYRYDDSPSADASWLKPVAPQSPLLLAAQIRDSWDDDKAKTWEAEHGSHPVVAFALGKKYAEIQKWSDAERCLRQYIAASPDLRGYETLADVYLQQNQTERWLATLEEFLSEPDYGLQHAQVQVKIARYYMNQGHYDKALPFADAAAQTAAGWAMLCAVDAHTGNGDWDGAQQIIKDEIDHYSESPFSWYAWCLRTGHGDRAGAAVAALNYFAGHQVQTNSGQVLQLACIDMLEKREKEALQVLMQPLGANSDPSLPLHLAIIADSQKDYATRDSTMKVVDSLPDQSSALAQFGGVLNDAMQAGSTKPNTVKIDEILKGTDGDTRITICFLTGRYLENHGDKEGAIACYKRCIFGPYQYSIDLLLAYDALRQHGIDPLKLEQSIAVPTTRDSTDP